MKETELKDSTNGSQSEFHIKVLAYKDHRIDIFMLGAKPVDIMISTSAGKLLKKYQSFSDEYEVEKTKAKWYIDNNHHLKEPNELMKWLTV